MNLSAPFINRPIGTTLLAIGIALAGILAFYLLPVAPLPQVEFPTIIVQASLPGASPEIMASSVATPIEKQLSRIAGITDMTSGSSLGSTRIIIQFDLSRDIDGAARDVQAALNASAADLPANLPTNPSYNKVNPSDAPIMIIALYSDTYSMDKIYDYASTELQQRVLKIDGVGQVTIGGGSLPAVRVEANPMKLNKYGISLTDIKSSIIGSNVNSATGQLVSGDKSNDISINSQISKAAEYAPIIISNNNNGILRLSDVADVEDSVQNVRNMGLLNGKPAIALVIFKEPGANIINTVDNITKTMPFLKRTIPAGITMHTVMDRTTTIRASLHDVEKTLLISIALVIAVVYLFLGNIVTTFIPALAMSLSLLGTFAVMKLTGFSLNNLSLMALSIATGFVVDDAIVVLENIARYRESGMKAKDAALKGAKEIGFTVTSISISLIAVFIPIIFMGGIVGRLFREFALTLAISIFISLLVSLTLTPMLCSKLLSKMDSTPRESKIKKFYEVTLRKAMSRPKTMLLLTFSTIVLNIILFALVPKGFFPIQDTGRIMGSIVTDQDTSFQALTSQFRQFIKVIQEDNNVENVVGFTGSGSVNSGSIFITLKDLGERKISSEEVIARLRGKLGKVAGSTVYLQSAQDLVIGGRQGSAQFQYTLSGNSIEEVNQYAPVIMEKLKNIDGVMDMNNDQRDHGLETYVKVDYDKAASFGISMQAVDSTLYSAFGQSIASTIYTDLNQYYVVLEVAPKYWQYPETLNYIYVKSTNNNLVPLSAFAKFENRSTLLSVNHQGLYPSATLSFNLKVGKALGNVVNSIDNAIAKLGLPATIQSSFRGTAQAFQDSLKSEKFLIMAALISVYIVLGMLYESLIHPVTILLTIPSAGVGALLALLLTGTDLNVIAIIGVILLIGIVKKNAIIMIDFVLEISRHKKISTKEAMFEAATLRFRPIMMTTMAALLGAVPLAFGSGTGSEMRKPLGIAIIGGLIFSQMLTLYTIPIIYMYMEKLKNKFKRKEAINVH